MERGPHFEWSRRPMVKGFPHPHADCSQLDRRRHTMGSSIICGVDGSPESRVALRVASELATALRLHLVVAHVSPAAVFAPAYGSAPVLTAPPVSELRAGEQLLEELALDEELANATLRAVHGA